ncbi:hypothetical protein RvY_03274 [Ramazzottius varieornatus]|uniref:Small ribosomal subunit protein mS26 n=1 Tax=Ramazzottius varieornatus TaxID=947166 RepID=A0A1D1UWW2_RAMVA|nr:hypothetical protein RvY_03274 [Ramazzottius varieornatus]
MLRVLSGVGTSCKSGGYPSSATCLPQVIFPTVLSPTSSLLALWPSAINVVTQRWKYRARKLPGAPRSRKKRYYTRVPTPRVPEEMAELFWRYSHYRTEMRALREHFAQWKLENHPAEAAPASVASSIQNSPTFTIDAEFAEAIRFNNELNERNAAKRNARREQEMEFRMVERRDILIQKQNEEFEEQEKYEELIERKKVAGFNTNISNVRRLGAQFARLFCSKWWLT